jgi:hypothetical protein
MNKVEEFAHSVLPWISGKVGLEWNGSLPTFYAFSGETMAELISSRCAAAYSPTLNGVAVNEEIMLREGIAYCKSAIVHELVHFLQAQNGLLDNETKLGVLLGLEDAAYKTQADFLWERFGIDPKVYKLDPLGRELGVLSSSLDAVRGRKEGKKEEERERRACKEGEK